MAQTFTAQEIKTLDQTRQRLSQLTNALASLEHSLLTGNPLPSYSSLHSQTLILGQTLTSLAGHLNATQSTSGGLQFGATAVYPLPSYPGRDEEGLLSQLLRKKLEVGVEEWVEQGREEGQRVLTSSSPSPGAAAAKWRALWEWAGIEANGVARVYDWGGDLEDEDEEEDDEDGEEDGAGDRDAGDAGKEQSNGGVSGGTLIPLDDMMRFMAKGGDVRK